MTHAFIWDVESGMKDITPSTSRVAKATDISNTGIVVGTITPFDAFEWTQKTGLRMERAEQNGSTVKYLGVADNGTKLTSFFDPDVRDGETRYFLSSIPGQDDLTIGSTGFRQFTWLGNAVINHNGIAGTYKNNGGGYFYETRKYVTNFFVDSNTRRSINVLDSRSFDYLAFKTVDINDRRWIVSEKLLYIFGNPSFFQINEELIAESSEHQELMDTLIVRALNNHGDLVGHITLTEDTGSERKVAVLLINKNRQTQSSRRVAQFTTDFDNPQASGWSYQWNSDVPIGQSDGYIDMLWDRWKYDSDGMPGLPDNSGLAYGHFSANGGHPGQGKLQGETHDRYVIAGFTVDETAEYKISDSQLIHSGCEFGNGGVVDVYVDDGLIDSFSFLSMGETQFDSNLGLLNAGRKIYVAVGSKGKDTCDGFNWDYAIDLIGNDTDNEPPVLVNPGNRFFKVNRDSNSSNRIHFLYVSDPEDDALTFKASGLPDGFSIDSVDGSIFGVYDLSVIGIYHILVTVTDDKGNFDTAAFIWEIAEQTFIAAHYSADFNRQPKEGWSYQWNPVGPIGQSDDYIDMLWDRWKYDSDGMPGLPDASSLAYGHLSKEGGHPGKGTSQGEANDRYVIVRFTVDVTASYRISRTRLTHTGCEHGDSGQILALYIDDVLKKEYELDPAGSNTFNRVLNIVNAGSVISLAVGAVGNDVCDGFDWDFQIRRDAVPSIDL